MTNAPALFRLILQVPDLNQAAEFYAKLLADEGRRIPRASRHYFDCGAVILALVDPTPGSSSAKPIPDYIYFSVNDLEAVYLRASELGCLSTEDVHGTAPARSRSDRGASARFMLRTPGAMVFASWRSTRSSPVANHDLNLIDAAKGAGPVAS